MHVSRMRRLAGGTFPLALALALLWPGAVGQADSPQEVPVAASAGADLEALRASVVKVFTVAQAEDYRQPWQRPRPEGWGGSAFQIGPRMLLTNAHVVSDAKNLQVKRADRVKQYEARVLFAGHDCDLGVITVDDEAFWDGMVPLELGARPAMRSKVMTVGYPTGGSKLSVTEGVVSRIEVNTYSHTGADDHLAIQTDAAINPGNSGGPVMQDGRVVGVAFQGRMFAQNIGYMIAPSVIRHFLDDIADGTYDGYPELGIYTANLRNPTLRRFLGVPEHEDGGVLVLKPMPYASAVGKVRHNDVILKIDGLKVEADGTVEVGSEFLDFTFVVEGKQIGETVVLTVLRDGEVIEVSVPLAAWGARMQPGRVYDERPEYVVLGGYLFLPLTENYLGWGRSNDLSYYMTQYYRTVAEEGRTREQLVLLSRVLPHPSTRYIDYTDAIVETVDGVTPNDFRHFVELIDGAQANLIKVEFEGVNVPPLILDMETIRSVGPKIREQYEIAEERFVKPRPEEK